MGKAPVRYLRFSGLPLCLAAMPWLLATGGCQPVPQTALARPTVGANHVCESLRPFGRPSNGWKSGLETGGRHTCSTGPARSGTADWGNVSLEAFSVPADPYTVERVALEGVFADRASRTTTIRQMQWAVPAVFSRLGLEVPAAVASGIGQENPIRETVGTSTVTVESTCSEFESKFATPCRITVAVQLAASPRS